MSEIPSGFDPNKEQLKPQDVSVGVLGYWALLCLFDSPKSGYDIIKQTEELTDGQVKLPTGNLYVTLKGYERLGVIATSNQKKEGARENSHPYELTPFGEAVLMEYDRRKVLALAAVRRNNATTLEMPIPSKDKRAIPYRLTSLGAEVLAAAVRERLKMHEALTLIMNAKAMRQKQTEQKDITS